MFSPLNLFSNGEVGGWYDPSDLTTLFQDAAGTTPVTAVEQPVGLVLDKSRGLVLGSELVTNGDFSASTGWTLTGANLSITGGKLVFNNAGATVYATQSILTIGKTYKITLTVSGYSAGALRVYSGANASPSITANGTYTYYLQCTSETLLYLLSTSGSNTYSVDDVSVRELPGNHLSQSTSTARPVLSARVNLLTRTEEFDNAAWTKSNATVTANQGTDPLGGNTADKFAAASDANVLQLLNPAVSGLTYTFSVWIKGVSSSGTTEIHWSHAAVTPVNTTTVNFTTSWQRFTVTGSIPSTVGYAQIGTWGSRNSGPSADILIWGADLRPANAGVGLPAYQRVTTSTDYDTTGFPLYLKFDGTDDFLVSGTISPGSVDKAQVFAGVRKLSDGASAILAEYGTDAANVNGSLALFAPAGSGANKFQFTERGSIAIPAYTTSATYNAPTTNVIAGIGDISGDTATLRINSAQIVQDTGDQGTGNFASLALYVGRRGGATLPLNANLYSLILRFSATNMDAATIASTETWVNSKTGAY